MRKNLNLKYRASIMPQSESGFWHGSMSGSMSNPMSKSISRFGFQSQSGYWHGAMSVCRYFAGYGISHRSRSPF